MAEETITLDGKIVDALPNAMFRVELENGHTVTYARAKCVNTTSASCWATASRSKMSPYDLTGTRHLSLSSLKLGRSNSP